MSEKSLQHVLKFMDVLIEDIVYILGHNVFKEHKFHFKGLRIVIKQTRKNVTQIVMR